MSKKLKKDKVQEENKSRKRYIIMLITRGSLLVLLLITTTYAWFTTQKDIRISNFRGTVDVAESMEISLDAKTWYRKIDLSELTDDNKTPLAAAVESRNAASGGTAPNIEPMEMLPVSTVGEVGSRYIPFYQGEAKAKAKVSLTDIEVCEEIDGSAKGVDSGYFAFDIYIRNSCRDEEPDVLQLNLNSSLQVLQEEYEKQIVIDGQTVMRKYEGKAFSGLQNTMRVALALYEDTADLMASQREVLEVTKGSNISKIAIWEPNAPYHVQYIVENNNNLTGAGAKKFDNGDVLTTYALTSQAAAGSASIENVYNTDDGKLSAQKTIQTEAVNTKEGEEDYRISSEDRKSNRYSRYKR